MNWGWLGGSGQSRAKHRLDSNRSCKIRTHFFLDAHAKHFFLHCKHSAYMRSVTHRMAVYLGLPQGGWLRDSEVSWPFCLWCSHYRTHQTMLQSSGGNTQCSAKWLVSITSTNLLLDLHVWYAFLTEKSILFRKIINPESKEPKLCRGYN